MQHRRVVRHRRQPYPKTILTTASLLFLAIGVYGYVRLKTPVAPPIMVERTDPSVDESTVSQTTIDHYVVPKGNPRYISIPALNIADTRVYPVGLTSQNALDTPKNIYDVAWYKASAMPGSGSGAMLIDGHNGGTSKDGVFAHLSKLMIGDQIIIERGDGRRFFYSVTENRTMSLAEANATGMKMMQLSADPHKEGLNLITCAGKWNPRYGQFDQRIMVRAVAM